jgi:trafficking protein particle complex subunit 12
LAIARDQFVEAAGHFSRALEVDPRNIAAANNRATCWLYASQLNLAITGLEDIIWNDPYYALQEALVFNLCSLYDLQSGNSIPKKMALLELINAYAHEGFERTVLKLPQQAS